MYIRNRELSQFGSFIYITDDTKNIAITTESTPYVGIGTTSPQRKLHVVGDIQIDGDLFYQGQLTLGNVDIQTTGIITASQFFNAVGQELKSFDSWQQKESSVYQVSANVGIGTTNPLSKLDVRGDITASRFISTNTTSGNTPPFLVNSSDLVQNLNADFLRGGTPGGILYDYDIVTIGSPQPLYNKTLTTPIISSSGAIFNGSTSGSTTLRASSIAGGNLTLPSNSGTLVGTGDVGVITPSMIANLSIVNSDVSATANITYNKLNLSNSITNNDLAGGITNNKLVNSSISGVPLGSNLQFLLRGSYISGSNYNGSSSVTWDVDATSSATANKVVARDSSGNFSTNTISLVNDLNVPNGTVSTRSLSVGTGGGSISGSLSVSNDLNVINGTAVIRNLTVTNSFTGPSLDVGATYATTAGIATYATTAGISTYSVTSNYATTAGISTYSSTTGYATTAGISTAAQSLTGNPNITVTTITANNASFSGNVTIGGTLSYVNITNEDSVGLLTARDGINVGPPTSIGATITPAGAATFSGPVIANSFIKPGGTSSQFLKADGSIDSNVYAITASSVIPSGSVLLFYQVSAPLGWTQITSQNNKALRVVSGTGGGTGGTTQFTSVFTSRTTTGSVSGSNSGGGISATTAGGSVSGSNSGGTVNATTLTTTTIPSHSHNGPGHLTNNLVGGAPDYPIVYGRGGLANNTTFSSGFAGGGASHNHGFTNPSWSGSFTGLSHTHTLTPPTWSGSFTGGTMDFSVQYIDIILCSKN